MAFSRGKALINALKIISPNSPKRFHWKDIFSYHFSFPWSLYAFISTLHMHEGMMHASKSPPNSVGFWTCIRRPNSSFLFTIKYSHFLSLFSAFVLFKWPTQASCILLLYLFCLPYPGKHLLGAEFQWNPTKVHRIPRMWTWNNLIFCLNIITLELMTIASSFRALAGCWRHPLLVFLPTVHTPALVALVQALEAMFQEEMTHSSQTHSSQTQGTRSQILAVLVLLHQLLILENALLLPNKQQLVSMLGAE